MLNSNLIKTEVSTPLYSQNSLKYKFQGSSTERNPKVFVFDDPVLKNSESSNFFFNQERAKYLLNRQSLKLTTTIDDSSKRVNIQSKNELNHMFKDLYEIIPEWLISRTDVQISYQKMKQAENLELENIVQLPSVLRSEDEKRALFL